jgi:CRP-like cAMP-binding protein
MSSYDVSLDHIERFARLTPKERDAVARAGTYVTVPAGWAIMGEGTPADKAYLVLNGSVSVRQHGEQIAEGGPGDIIGELAIVNHHLRSATVVATSDLECLHFTSEALLALADELPGFRSAVETSAAQHMAQ